MLCLSYKNKKIVAGHVRNNRDIIKHVCLEKLRVDVSNITEKDREYIKETPLNNDK